MTDTTTEITSLYQTVLDRAPDAAGLTFWTGQIAAGATLPTIAAAMLTGPEGMRDFAPLTADLAFVEQLYTNALHRAPDIAGEIFWVGDVAAIGRAAVAVAFSETPEALNILGVPPQSVHAII